MASSSLYTVPRIVTSGKPIRMRNVVQHRTDHLIQEQVAVIRGSQEVFSQSLRQLDFLPTDNDRLVDRMRHLVEEQRIKLNEMILITQILSKIKRELVHARGELKRALRTNTNIYGARKRLVWLESQLEYLVKEKCPKKLEPIDVDTILTPPPSPTPPPTPHDPTPTPAPTEDSSDDRSDNEKAADNMRDALSRMDSNMMTKEEIQDTWNKYKERKDAPRVEVDYDALLEDLLVDEEEEEEDDGEDEEALAKLAGLGIDLTELAKPSRLSHVDMDEERRPESDTEEAAADLADAGSGDAASRIQPATPPDQITDTTSPTEAGDQKSQSEKSRDFESQNQELRELDSTLEKSRDSVSQEAKSDSKSRDLKSQSEKSDKIPSRKSQKSRDSKSKSAASGKAGSRAKKSRDSRKSDDQELMDDTEGAVEISASQEIAESLEVVVKSPGIEEIKAEGDLVEAEVDELVPEVGLEREKTDDSLEDGTIEGMETRETTPDVGRDYWHSEHHRFEFPEHAQTLVELDPLSYHQVGLAVPGTFIKTASKSTPTLPWRPKQPGEIHDVHRVALDKLSVKVQKMYSHIFDAAMLSVDASHGQVQDRGNFLQNATAKPSPDGGRSSATGSEQEQATVLPPIKSRSGPMVALQFHSKPIPHAQRLPISKLKLRESYPRCVSDVTSFADGRRDKPQRIVNQGDLHAETKLTSSLFRSKMRRTSSEPALEITIHELEKPSDRSESRLRKTITVARVASGLSTESPMSAVSQDTRRSEGVEGRPADDSTGMKWRRVQELVSVNMASNRDSDRAEAAKQLGLMGCSESSVLARLEEGLTRDTDLAVRYECANALVRLGCVSELVLSALVENLVRGNSAVRHDVLRAIIAGRDLHLINKSLENFKVLVKVLNKLLHDPGPGSVAYDAAVCLGRLGVVSEGALKELKVALRGGDSSTKAEALSTLVREVSCRDTIVLEAIFSQLKSSYCWRHRADAAKLLISLGPEVVCKETKATAGPQFLTVGRAQTMKTKHTNQFDYVYGLVEARLWDEPSYDVRKVVAMAVKSLGMLARACERAEKKLEDPDEKVRAQGVITVGTLGLKKKSVVKTLLEMVELDSSEYVRLQVMKTFGLLGLREKKVLRCLRERAKAGGLLGKEATKVLKNFGEPLEV